MGKIIESAKVIEELREIAMKYNVVIILPSQKEIENAQRTTLSSH